MFTAILAGGPVPAELASDYGPICSAALPIAGYPVVSQQLSRLTSIETEVAVSLPPRRSTLQVIVGAVSPATKIVGTTEDEDFASVLLRMLIDSDVSARSDEPLIIIFGDSLSDFPYKPNSIAIQERYDAQRYTTVHRTRDGDLRFEHRGALKVHHQAVVGAFHLASRDAFTSHLFRSCQADSQEPFYEALASYDLAEKRLCFEMTSEWLDLGHLDTYYDARKQAFTSRHFNDVKFRDGGTVVKSSLDSEKITREIMWYRSLPRNLTLKTPRFVDYAEGTKPWYEIEYIANPTLSDLLLWGDLGLDDWQGIFKCINDLLVAMWSHPEGNTSAKIVSAARETIYIDKTASRLAQLRRECPDLWQRMESDFTLDGQPCVGFSSVGRMLPIIWKDVISGLAPTWGFIHGDLFPGNILYDRRQQKVTILDPRGSFGMPGPHGDFLYDLGKLAHSFHGKYDGILAGLLEVQSTGPGEFMMKECVYLPEWLSAEYHEMEALWATHHNCDSSTIRLIESLLFLGMLPLHSEDAPRQATLAAKGLELFTAWSNGQK